MGNCLAYPPKVEYDRQQKIANKQRGNSYSSSMTRANLQGTNHTVLPFNSFNRKGGTDKETYREERDIVAEELRLPNLSQSPNVSQIEVETTRLGSNPSSRTSSFKRQNKYIKRYRNEEEKLTDMLQERERVIKSAIKQGQELRAKCTRYKEELDSLKALSDVDMTDVEWKKRYNELDERYRTMKEELDVLSARNKNGRDFLNQQKETIQLLTEELQHERISRQSAMSSSLSSLTSVGVTDRKGKLMIAQLETEKRLLEHSLNELFARNKRGRDYLSKLEAEKRDQETLMTKLKTQLLKEREEKENLLVTVKMLSTSTPDIASAGLQSQEPEAVYAKVNENRNIGVSKARTQPSETLSQSGKSNYSGYSEVTETKSLGFEIDTNHGYQQERPASNVHDDVDNKNDYIDGRHTITGQPFIHTYVMEDTEEGSTGPGSDNQSSTPRFVIETQVDDDEPVWYDMPGTGVVNIENVTTKF
ncbi:hypothetical protein ACF0H5_011006 [Mactra antiquata]